MILFIIVLSIIFMVVFIISISILIYHLIYCGHSGGINIPEHATHQSVIYSSVDQRDIMFTPEFRQQVSVQSNETQYDFVTSERENEQPK